MTANKVIVHTDGACSGNPGPGGWGAIVVWPDGVQEELSGGAPDTTNNRMEYTAALEGLRALPDGSCACIVTDSRLMLNSMTKWIAGWKRKGWRTAAGDPVANQDLVRALDAEGVRVADLKLHAPSLDDVFLAKTGRSLEGAAEDEDGAAESAA